MRASFRTSITLSTVVVIVAIFGTLAADRLVAESQHGRADDPDSHFELVAQRLELTDPQRDALAGPFQEAFAAMEKLHRLHEQIAAELSEEQRAAFAEMVHDAMTGPMSGLHEEGHEEAEGHGEAEGH